jgi:hypothetical protein
VDGLILVIPSKSDSERDAVADAWKLAGGCDRPNHMPLMEAKKNFDAWGAVDQRSLETLQQIGCESPDARGGRPFAALRKFHERPLDAVARRRP